MIQGYLKLNGLTKNGQPTQEQLVSIMYDVDCRKSRIKAIKSVLSDYLNLTEADKVNMVIYQPIETEFYEKTSDEKNISDSYNHAFAFDDYNKVKLYLEWVNNWISPTAFMDHYYIINREEFDKIIDKGRELNEQLNPKK